MIVFDNVTKYYKSNVGLEKVSVRINKGDFVFLVGPSGAGKSTFIKLILKEIDATSGSIKVRGREVTTMSNRQVPILRRNIGIVFQDFRLLPKKTVYENVAFAMEIIHQPKKLIKKYVPQVLSMVGIASKANKYPDELSAGEQQRVAIARAIVNRPRILIADEPTGNLDPDTAWEIMQLLDQINKRGTTILMVTHAKDIVDKMGKRVIAIEKGGSSAMNSVSTDMQRRWRAWNPPLIRYRARERSARNPDSGEEGEKSETILLYIEAGVFAGS